jgi:RNA polymerase sigma factor (sigma-70 family)
MKKNLGLNEKSFNELVAKLKNGDEKLFEIAFEELAKDGIRSLKIRFKSDVNTAKDVVIDSLLIFRNKLINGKIKYGNLKYLFLKMANQNYLRQIKKSSLVIAISDKVDIDSHFTEQEEPKYSDSHYKKLNKAFDLINRMCKELLEKYYRSRKKTNEIAVEYGVSNDVIRKRKQRCLDSLRETISF